MSQRNEEGELDSEALDKVSGGVNPPDPDKPILVNPPDPDRIQLPIAINPVRTP